ncbi:MAG: hypothetical protein CK548_07260 [Opitutia bacterium]|nr:hypothetical protein [Opitutaceae bacterium]PHX71232.1 MAG: hypothetical protein CK548_07260 [Opitutae bacterium]
MACRGSVWPRKPRRPQRAALEPERIREHVLPRVGEAVVAVVVALVAHAVEDVLHVHLRAPGRVAEFFPVGREGAEDVGVVGLLRGDHIDAGDGDAADRFALLKPGVAAEREALHDAFGKAVAAREAHRVARARCVVGGVLQVLLGELFVVRGAGNTLNDHVIGSVESAVEHLQASVILVVGHEKCRAGAAAGGGAEGRIGTIRAAFMPAVRESRNQAGDKTDNAGRSNARLVAKTLPVTSPLIASAVQTGQIKIFAARCDLVSGRVELLT